MRQIYVILLLFYVYNVISVSIKQRNEKNDVIWNMQPEIYKTIDRYYCFAENDRNITTGISLLLYGTNEWVFPQQDVNLTLRYPSENNADSPDYIITGFQVILSTDGGSSRGFLVSGGVLRGRLTLVFTSGSVRRLHYQFWVYGVRRDSADYLFKLFALKDAAIQLCN